MPFPQSITWALIAAGLTGCAAVDARSEMVACRIEYGGTTLMAGATPAASAYDVVPVRVGSFFLFRIVFQQQPAAQAAVKLYTYAQRDNGPMLIHQARFPYPPPRPGAARFGFTGLQSVYEPEQDSELQYWCELRHSAASGREERAAPGGIDQ